MDNWISKEANPFDVFQQWYEKAIVNNSFEPTKMTLATVDKDGMPSGRIVLLKVYDEKGFCFFGNYDSVKSKELMEHPKAALVFHWEKPLHQQIRIRGLVEKMSYEESNTYFQKRPRGSQLGAWASPQSQEITGREELLKRVEEVEKRFENEEVIPCPENWGGFRIKPLSFEFWESQEFRLHDRIKFVREDLESSWTATRLAP